MTPQFSITCFFMLIFSSVAINSQAQTNFSYTGGEQSFTAPAAGNYRLQVWGGQGGGTGANYWGTGGYGGYSTGTISLTQGQTIYIYVGQQGFQSTRTTAYNGGGYGNYHIDASNGFTGGGATHISKVQGLLSTLSGQVANGDLLIAAGGGGGAAGSTGNVGFDSYAGNGGAGGGTSGSAGVSAGGRVAGGGGTQSLGGTSVSPAVASGFGVGACADQGEGDEIQGGGGGGGYYGGGAGSHNGGGGGGGSAYIDGVSNSSTQAGIQTGNGSARVSLTQPVEVFVAGNFASGYSTLKAAFDAINAGTHKGVITITMNASTTETSSAVLYASGTGSSSYTSIYIYPTITGLTITGNLGSPLIDLNGADNVTIDGRVNATGGTVSLVIINTNTSGNSTSAIRFINNATNNTVKYCKIQGSNTATNGAILIFSTTASGTSGNNSNLVDHNEITCAGANRPKNVIYSIGSSTASNISNTISNNNIYNFLNPTDNSCGILLAEAVDTKGYNSDWSITGNSFYETTTFQPSGGSYNIIYINTQNNGTSYGDNFTISYNYIGGSGPGCTGTFSKTTGNNYFWGIQLHVGIARASNIQGNTISNINYTNTGGPDWWGIYIDWGAVNMGNIAPNYIGAASDGGSITYSCDGNNGRFLAIHLQGDGNCYVQKNVISSITVNNTNSANATSFWGIHQQARANTNVISNNTIGSATTANSIRALSASTATAQTVIGYSGDGNGGTMTVSNNTIANLTNGTTNTTADTKGKVYGIWAFAGGSYTISGNAIHDLTIANANTQTGPVPGQGDNTSLSAGGILFSGSYDASHTISGNTVYNISNTHSSFAGTVAGVYFYGQPTVSSVQKNLIYGLSSGSSSANIHGISIGGGVTTYSNNIITLGGNTTTSLYGIYEPGLSGSTSNIYFNTVYLSGSLTSGSMKSACLYNAGASSTRNFRNNIFVNARSNSESGSGTHYAFYAAAIGGALTCDYNDYFVSGTGGTLGYFGGAKTVLPIVTGVTGNDAHSKNSYPVFASATPGTTAADYLPTASSLLGVTGTNITTDYDGGDARSATLPAMGAFEYPVTTCTAPAIGSQSTATQTQCFNGTFTAITVTATGDGLAYQWYSKATAENSGGSALGSNNGAQTYSYTPQAGTAGTLYYYCVVTGTCGTATSAVSGAFIVIPASVGGILKW